MPMDGGVRTAQRPPWRLTMDNPGFQWLVNLGIPHVFNVSGGNFTGSKSPPFHYPTVDYNECPITT